jgi:hypothetical protein
VSERQTEHHAASVIGRASLPELTPEARLAKMTEIANAYRIEADCAMRDYDGLEVDAGIMREALQQIADARPNRAFDPWARELARAALAQVSEKVTDAA